VEKETGVNSGDEKRKTGLQNREYLRPTREKETFSVL
jgi:hypothetical protein